MAGRIVFALICICLSAAVAGADARGEARGTRSCRKWAEERALAEGQKEMNRIPVLISKSWFLGYIAGRASGAKRDLLADIDDESIFLWLDNYCRDHPRENLARAGLALEREVTPARAGLDGTRLDR